MENDTNHRNYVNYDPLRSHRHFAGLIFPSDFCDDYPLYPGDIAKRIESSLRFDYFCQKLDREREHKWKK